MSPSCVRTPSAVASRRRPSLPPSSPRFSLFDIDERNFNAGGDPPVLERALFHSQTATAYQLWPSAAESDVEVGCEDGSTPPCGSDRTRFLRYGNKLC